MDVFQKLNEKDYAVVDIPRNRQFSFDVFRI